MFLLGVFDSTGLEYGMMLLQKNIIDCDFSDFQFDQEWNTCGQKELLVHRMHSYPAKFPFFITTKALKMASEKGIKVETVADVFCGCGTTSIETKRLGKDFWGCDINPVATMIAKAKSAKYDVKELNELKSNILYKAQNSSNIQYQTENARLKYWYDDASYDALNHLLWSINDTIDGLCSNDKYFFYCAFSNILKASSRWLTKSIKPQVDKAKKPVDVFKAFSLQVEKMIKAVAESNQVFQDNHVDIVTDDFLKDDLVPPKVDAVITSPPYVTSYEYADLHQLSSLWLGYTDDYKNLRTGTIGSSYGKPMEMNNLMEINKIGLDIVLRLKAKGVTSKAKSVARYFLDMQKVSRRVFDMLNPAGFALFVIGNTEYKGVLIDNAKHLAVSLFEAGFSSIDVAKRKISNKILTPYRDCEGRFSSNQNGKKIYSEEFILIARK